MQKYILLTLLFLAGMTTFAQDIVWDGGGDMTSWDDPLNWDSDIVPPTDSIAVFGTDAIITGTMTNVPALVRITAHTNITFDLDLSVGNSAGSDHAFVLNDSCTVVLGTPGSNRVFNISPASNKQGLAIFGGSDGVSLEVAESTTLNFLTGQVGLNLSNTTSTVANNGSIVVEDAVRNGVRVKGDFTNAGSITVGAVGSDAVQVQGGSFVNTAAGSVTVAKPNDDCIEIQTDGVFENAGILVLTAKDDAASANACIAVGTADEAGSFSNTSLNVFADGGLDTFSRAVFVYPTGSVSNAGALNLSGGFPNNRLFVQGAVTNELNGMIDLGDGRANVSGMLTNNGLLTSERGGSGIFTTGTVINNAFFDYLDSNQFATGSDAVVEDNGISLNNNDTRINAMNDCTVDIAEASYEWSLDGMVLGTSDASGSFTFAENSVMTDSVIMTTTIPGVEIKVVNICDDAVEGTNGVLAPLTAQSLPVFPNPIQAGTPLQVDLSEVSAGLMTFNLVNQYGQVIAQYQLQGGQRELIDISELPTGLYLLSGQTLSEVYTVKLMIR